MNKTVNINLGGLIFHIDEDAYQKLARYIDAIKRSLTNANGQDEIIKDIEMRIAELISEKHTSDKQVINLKELDEVIAVMGQPEDYRIDAEGDETTNTFSNASSSRTKKLYRDREAGIIGGVASGLSHYFGIDKAWIRLFFLIIMSFGGAGIIAYIILLIVMPEAVTTADKLEMKGEAVTISNIEKKVREEFETVSSQLKNVDYDKIGNQIKSNADRIGSNIGDVIMNIFKVFAKFLGVLIIIASIFILVGLFIGVFTLGSVSVIQFPWSGYIEAGNVTDYPIWAFGLLMLFAVGIPFFFLSLLGFKLLTPNMKSIGAIAKSTLFALWLIAIALVIALGIKQASAYAFDGRVINKQNLNITSKDTLFIKFRFNENFAKNIDDHEDFKVTQDSINNDIIYSNDIRFKIIHTDEQLPYIQIEKEASGKTLNEAKNRAEKIQYHYTFEKNHLILDNYLITDLKNKFRNQKITINLYVPKGVLFKTDNSVESYDESDNEFFNMHFSSDKFIYQVGDSKVKCLNCPEIENEWDDIDSNTKKDSTVIITEKKYENGQLVKETVRSSGLTTDSNGVIQKK